MALSPNLTNPENPRDINHEALRSWDYREDVVGYLMCKGLPLRCAEVAAIDFKGIVNACYHNRLTFEQAGRMLYEKATEIYQREDGSWPYAE